MAKYKTTITKKDGTKASGYIENGRSYYDDGTSISTGDSVVDSTGKKWTKGGTSNDTSSVDTVSMINNAIKQNNSSNSTSKKKESTTSSTTANKKNTNYTASNIDYIEKRAEAQKIAQNAAYQKAYEKVLSSLNSEKDTTKTQFNKAKNDADTDNKISTKNYFENVANRGQTNSGSTSQGELALKIAGQNNQSELISKETESLADIERRKTEAESDYLYNVIASNANIEAQKYQNLLEQYRLDEQNSSKAEAESFNQEIATITQYYDDYTAEIERRTALDPNDKLLPYLRIARQEKINEINEKAVAEQKAQAEAVALAEEQRQAQAKLLMSMNDFEGLRALGYDTTQLEKEYNANLANTQSLINSRDNGTSNNNGKISKNYNTVLKGVQGYLKSNGTSYEENKAGAKYLVGEYNIGNINTSELMNIMNQTGMPIEVMARSLYQYGMTDENILAFVATYFNEKVSDEYLQKILEFAKKAEYSEK